MSDDDFFDFGFCLFEVVGFYVDFFDGVFVYFDEGCICVHVESFG